MLLAQQACWSTNTLGYCPRPNEAPIREGTFLTRLRCLHVQLLTDGAEEIQMKTILKIAAVSVFLIAVGTISASADCNGDASTETVLGAGSGALVGGLASHSLAGAAIGGVAGGLIGNSIGHANNREDCRRDAYYDRERQAYPDREPSDYRDAPNANYDYPDRDGSRHYDDEN